MIEPYKIGQRVYVTVRDSSYYGEYGRVVDVQLPNLFELRFSDGHCQWFSIDEISV